jgi:uncharacterized protein YndB with AHSA1/START domain
LAEPVGADTLRFVRHFNASSERIWQALATPEGIAAWLGHPVVIEAVVGGAFEIELAGAHLSEQPPVDVAARYAALKPEYDARLAGTV